MEEKTKFCKHCGEKIPEDAILCTKCGRQVEELKKSGSDQIIINNNNNASSSSSAAAVAVAGLGYGRPKNKWVALTLCICLGFLSAHKFYEGKAGTGILYLLTFGLFFIGVIIDIFNILSKPTIYYV